MMPLGGQVHRQLAAGRGLTGTLEPAHHDDGRTGLHEVDARVDRAQKLEQLVVDDLDHQLPGLEGVDDVLADGFVDDLVGEILDDLKIDVGLEQRGADLAHGFADVFLGDLPPAGERAENGGEFVG